MSDSPTHGPEEVISTREGLFSAILEAWLSDFIIEEPLNRKWMVWYRELISHSESHPRNKARIVKNLLTLIGNNEAEQRRNFELYEKDYLSFYEWQKPCIAKIALKSWSLFVRFKASERKQFQNIVGLIPEELLDISKPGDMFLYSMSEAT